MKYNDSKNKRFILISHEMTYTGAPRSLLNISVVLKRQGYNTFVYTLEDGPFEIEFKAVGINVKNYSECDINHLSSSDIVILNTVFTAYLCNEIKRVSLATVFLFIREAKNLSELISTCNINRRLISQADEVICVSEYAAEFILEYKPKKLTVIHNYVEDTYKLSLNVVHNNIINYLISGTYESRKGIDIAVRAFLMMPEELKKMTRLHIVGPTPEFSREFQTYVREIYDERIVEHGEIRDEKERNVLYKSMNVFLVPSRDESCSLVALEGAMLGKLVIMSENVGAQYILKNVEWVYTTDDIFALCRLMCNATSRKMLIYEGMRMRLAYKRTSTKKIFTDNILRFIKERV